MARRNALANAVPMALLVYRPGDWASTAAWAEARSEWMAAHPPPTLAALNAFYGPDVVFPPRPDPRESPDAA